MHLPVLWWLRSALVLIVAIVPLGSPFAEQDTVQIGATFPLTGDNASYGNHLKNAIELLKDKINSEGRISGKRIEVLYQDDANDPKQCVANVERFASVDHTPAVIGSAGSNCVLAMAPIANRTKTVIISPTASADDISHAGPFVFRTVPSDAYQGAIISKWIRDEGYENVGIFYVNNSWGVGINSKFLTEFKKMGGKAVAVEAGAELATDFRAQLTKLKNARPNALFMPTYAKQGGRAVRQAKEMGIELPMFGADPWDVPEFRQAAGSAANGVKFTVFSQYTGNEYKQMAKDYKGRYGEDPDFIAASGYDAMLVLAEAIKHLVTSTTEINGDNIKNVLHTIEVIGATGLNKFDINGDVISKTFATKTIREGKVVPSN